MPLSSPSGCIANRTEPHLQLVLAALQDTLTLPCLPLALISILTVEFVIVCGGCGFSLSLNFQENLCLNEKVKLPSFNVKSGITLDKT